MEKECGFQTERKEGLFYNSLKHQDLIPSQHHPENFEGTEDTVRDHRRKEPVPEDKKTEMKKEEPTESTVQHPPSVQPDLTTTRSGRAVKPPQKLDL